MAKHVPIHDRQKRGGRRRGRPPAPPGVTRRHRVVTFLNDAEFDRLSRLARERGDPLSLALYKLVRDGLGPSGED